MMTALLVLEAVLFMAVEDWLLSSSDLHVWKCFNDVCSAHRLTDEDPACDRTETHGVLARMGGHRVVVLVNLVNALAGYRAPSE
jgi:hypothetical protein